MYTALFHEFTIKFIQTKQLIGITAYESILNKLKVE